MYADMEFPGEKFFLNFFDKHAFVPNFMKGLIQHQVPGCLNNLDFKCMLWIGFCQLAAYSFCLCERQLGTPCAYDILHFPSIPF